MSVKAGLTDASLVEAEVKSRLIESSKSAIALIDHSKLNSIAFTTIVNLDALDVLITDQEPEASLRRWLSSHGVKLIVAKT